MPPIVCEFKETLLKVEGVNVTLDDKPILRDLNMEIRDVVVPGRKQGQVVGLLGPSGMGKTTLFRLLAGLDHPDSGDVLVTADLKPVQRGMVGVVSQDYLVFAHRTVRGNLMVAGKQARLSGRELNEKADELMKRFGLEEHARKYPSQLSGGQRQRVAIAQQFMCSEHFLLMDEPFSGLDVLAAGSVIGFIKEMAQLDEISTFILVTHDIAAATQVCDTILLLGRDRDSSGKVIPGARIQKTYSLIEMGLAWTEDIASNPECVKLIRDIRNDFSEL